MGTDFLGFLHILQSLKTTPRTGWVRRDIPNPESISDHMYRMAIIAMIAQPQKQSEFSDSDSEANYLNRDKCIRMCLVHDMAEALVGDFTPDDPVSKEEKHKLEKDAIINMTNKLDPIVGSEIVDLWKEYEEGATTESLFVKDIDKFELVVQLAEYEKQNPGCYLDDFWRSVDAIKNQKLKEYAISLMNQRKNTKSN